jgi:hypothetical protein
MRRIENLVGKLQNRKSLPDWPPSQVGSFEKQGLETDGDGTRRSLDSIFTIIRQEKNEKK